MMSFMRLFAASPLAVLSLLTLTTPAPAQGGTPFYLKSCNLDCNDGLGGQLVLCNVTAIPPNASLIFEWSDAVDLATISTASIQILDLGLGLTIPGTFSLKDPCTVVFTPVAGYANEVTLVLVQGTAQGDPGPYVQSTSGAPNLSKLAHSFSDSGPPSSVLSECQTSPNSVGPGAVVSWCGSSSLGLSDLELTVSGLPLNRFAVPLAGNSSAALPFGDGVLCLSSPFARLRPLNTGNGTVDYPVDWTGLPAQLGVAAGNTVRFQLLYRDAAGGPAGFNLSDAVVTDLVP